MNTTVKVRWIGALLVAMLALLATPSAAAQAAGKGQSAQAPGKKDAGLTQPSREEIKVLLDGIKQLVNQSTEGLEVKSLPGGGQIVDLEGRFQNIAVAKQNADGSVQEHCVTTVKEAEEFLTEDAKAKPAAQPQATTPLEEE